MFKCKYCKTKIGFFTWLLFLGKCYYCEEKINEPKKRWAELDRQTNQKDSNKYWRDFEELKNKKEKGR